MNRGGSMSVCSIPQDYDLVAGKTNTLECRLAPQLAAPHVRNSAPSRAPLVAFEHPGIRSRKVCWHPKVGRPPKRRRRTLDHNPSGTDRDIARCPVHGSHALTG